MQQHTQSRESGGMLSQEKFWNLLPLRLFLVASETVCTSKKLLYNIQWKIFFRQSFSIHSPCRHGYTSWMHPVAMKCRTGGEKVHTTRLGIDQNCTAMCTKKGGRNDDSYRRNVERSTLSALCFKRPSLLSMQVLATEPRAKWEVRSILCHTYQ